METAKSDGTRREAGGPWSAQSRRQPAVPPVRSDPTYFRKLIYLQNNRRVMLRPLHSGDRQNLISLFQRAADDDLRFFRHDLRNLRLLNYWFDHIDYSRLLPLAALDLDENWLIAAATLLKGKHSASHIGEIKLFISKPFRGLGLGSNMLDELIYLAAQEGLCWLKAEVVADQKQVIKALRGKGFQIRATLEDFFIRKDGVTHDVVLMMRSLMDAPEEF